MGKICLIRKSQTPKHSMGMEWYIYLHLYLYLPIKLTRFMYQHLPRDANETLRNSDLIPWNGNIWYPLVHIHHSHVGGWVWKIRSVPIGDRLVPTSHHHPPPSIHHDAALRQWQVKVHFCWGILKGEVVIRPSSSSSLYIFLEPLLESR